MIQSPSADAGGDLVAETEKTEHRHHRGDRERLHQRGVQYDLRAPAPLPAGRKAAQTEKMKRVVIVDDSSAYCDLWSNVHGRAVSGKAGVETYSHPYDALPKIDATIDLLIVDLEMPGMDGKKFVDYARQKGVPARRIVVTSSHSADELHERFRIGETIAVINKTDPKQQEAFLMILDSVMRRKDEG